MRCVGYRQVLEYLVHIEHAIFDKAHLDKAQFYSAFGEADLSRGRKPKPETVDEAMKSAESLACQQMQNKALYATRQLAKRQYTWLRKLTQLSNNADNNGMRVQAFDDMTQVRGYLY